MYTNTSRLKNSSTTVDGTSSLSVSTLSGREAWARQILKPGTSPPTLSCQPPPVVSICSTSKTAWISESTLAVRPAARRIAPSITPARMLLVPRPLPRGMLSDSVHSSKPAPYRSFSWSARDWSEGNVTMSTTQKQAFSRAPVTRSFSGGFCY